MYVRKEGSIMCRFVKNCRHYNGPLCNPLNERCCYWYPKRKERTPAVIRVHTRKARRAECRKDWRIPRC